MPAEPADVQLRGAGTGSEGQRRSGCSPTLPSGPLLHYIDLFPLQRQETGKEGEEQQRGLGIHTESFLSCYNWLSRARDLNMYVHACVWLRAFANAMPAESIEGVRSPLELELQVVFLETELRSCGRPGSALRCQAIFTTHSRPFSDKFLVCSPGLS